MWFLLTMIRAAHLETYCMVHLFNRRMNATNEDLNADTTLGGVIGSNLEVANWNAHFIGHQQAGLVLGLFQ